MKSPAFLFLTLVIISLSCEKQDDPGLNPGVTTFKYYISDSLKRTTGLSPMSSQQFKSFYSVKASSLLQFPANGRKMDLPLYIRWNMPPQIDQRGVPASAAIAVGYVARSYNYYVANKTTYVLSTPSGYSTLDTTSVFNAFFIYNQLPVDDRRNLYHIFDFILTKGISNYADMPATRDTTIQPGDLAKTNALKYKARGAYRLEKYDVEFFKRTLYELGYPIIVGVTIDNGFVRMNKAGFRERPRYDTGNLKVPIWNKYISAGDPSDDINYDMQKSLHTMVICGWDETNRAFLVFNSWGSQWGESGYMWVDYDFLKEALYYDDHSARPSNPYAFILTNDKSPMDGLVAGYEFSGNTNDMSGNGNHGVTSGNVSYSADRRGDAFSKSLKFEGSKLPGTLTIPNSSSLQFTDEATVSFWIRVDSVDGTDWYGTGPNTYPGYYVIYNFYTKALRQAGAFEAFDGLSSFGRLSHKPTFWGPDIALVNWFAGGQYGGNFFTRPESGLHTINTGDWHHVVNIYKKSGESTLYIDGKFAGAADTPVYFDKANNYDFVFNNFYKMNGAFDDIYIYNWALDAQQVSYLYKH